MLITLTESTPARLILIGILFVGMGAWIDSESVNIANSQSILSTSNQAIEVNDDSSSFDETSGFDECLWIGQVQTWKSSISSLWPNLAVAKNNQNRFLQRLQFVRIHPTHGPPGALLTFRIAV